MNAVTESMCSDGVLLHKPQEVKDSDEKENSAGDYQVELQEHLLLLSAA
jgi:hypothetical protein